MKKIAILGSTGSIGTQTLDVIRRYKNQFQIVALSANQNIELLHEQAKEFSPQFVVIGEEANAAFSQKKWECEVLFGEEGLKHVAAYGKIDMLINALIGKAGLIPTIEAIKRNIPIALANKETLVLAGELVMSLAKEHNTPIIPIDSELSALFQALHSGKQSEIKKVIITMGKGPIAAMSSKQLEKVTMVDILNRPNWDMGMKINIDSATCMNKAFEVIEAKWLLNIPPEKIDIIVHPEYLCHSIVEFVDGSMITELGQPDMKRYIQYALFYPQRNLNSHHSFLDLIDRSLSFEKPPYEKFPCLTLGHKVMQQPGTMAAALHGADSYAVKAFIEKKIVFTEIFDIIEKTLNAHKNILSPSLEEIIDAEKWAEQYAESLLVGVL